MLFRSMLASTHVATPYAITVDKHPCYVNAYGRLTFSGELSEDVQFRQSKYLNNIIEQDHRRIKWKALDSMGYQKFSTAKPTLSGIETLHMIRKKQLHLPDNSVKNQSLFIHHIMKKAA